MGVLLAATPPLSFPIPMTHFARVERAHVESFARACKMGLRITGTYAGTRKRPLVSLRPSHACLDDAVAIIHSIRPSDAVHFEGAGGNAAMTVNSGVCR